MPIMKLTSMFETHDTLQIIGIVGITVSYVIAVIFNTLNGIGGKFVNFVMTQQWLINFL